LSKKELPELWVGLRTVEVEAISEVDPLSGQSFLNAGACQSGIRGAKHGCGASGARRFQRFAKGFFFSLQAPLSKLLVVLRTQFAQVIP